MLAYIGNTSGIIEGIIKEAKTNIPYQKEAYEEN
jgi:hypothetical protein